MRQRIRTPESCPVCGEDVPPKARACPSCGADERSGWNDEADWRDGLDLPEEESGEDYDAFMEREFGVVPPRKRWIFWTALLLLVALGAAWFSSR